MNKLNHITAIWLLAMLMSACSMFGSPQVDSAKDAVAVSYATIGASAQSVEDLLRRDVIDADDARFCQAILERAYSFTELAEREALAGKPDSAQAILGRVSSLLSDLERFLAKE